MKYIVANSGGKDSQATWIWAEENLPDYEVVFCDTKWEHPFVYSHNEYLSHKLGKEIITLCSSKYDGFIDLCIKKKRVASAKSRFCTEKLKTEPMIDYILSCNCDITVLQGVRNDESESRRALKGKDEYFKFYFEPYGYDKKGRPKYHTYRKEEVFAYCEKYTVDVLRPVIKFTANEVIEFSIMRGFKINPLYFKGFGRVGCFPCVMCRLSEIRLIAQSFPERIDMIRELEKILGRTFFPPEYIPAAHCDLSTVNKKGKKVYYASIDAVVKYVLGDP